MADLQRRAKQPNAALDTEAEGQQEGVDRPSEWAGFIYNPYSGDLLPTDDDEDEDEQNTSQPESADDASGTRRFECVSMRAHAFVLYVYLYWLLLNMIYLLWLSL